MALVTGLAAINSLKSLFEIARDVRDSQDPDKLRAAAAQMFDLALAAREQTAILQEDRNAAVAELTSLKADVEKSNQFDDEAKNYTRERTHTGATVYREKDSGGPEGASPYYCPNCFTHKQISILNPTTPQNIGIGVSMYSCPVCAVSMPLPRLRPKL